MGTSAAVITMTVQGFRIVYRKTTALTTGSKLNVLRLAPRALHKTRGVDLMHHRRVIVAILACLSTTSCRFVHDALIGTPPPGQELEIGSVSLRNRARRVVLPVYPLVSIAAGHQGVAVAEVHISEGGRVTETRILEAPDQAITNALQISIKQWVFDPVVSSRERKALRATSRLVFYFKLDASGPVVVDGSADAARLENSKKKTRRAEAQ
jgi:hypothetical protein